MAVPKLDKVIVNIGLGEAVADPKVLDRAVEELAAITDKADGNASEKIDGGFKLRAGMPMGVWSRSKTTDV
jgi:large subunit ribosomal protein L5